MPNRDGTGPWGGYGKGAGAGRGSRRGYPFGKIRYRLLGAVLPLAIAAVKDLANPHGVLGGFARKLIGRKTERDSKAVKANYTIIEEKNLQKNIDDKNNVEVN